MPDFAEDWADTVRDRRRRYLAERGAPEGIGRWVIDNPRAAGWLLFLLQVVILGIWALTGWQGPAGERLLRGIVPVIGAAALSGGMAQMLRGEKLVLEEWLRSPDGASEDDQ